MDFKKILEKLNDLSSRQVLTESANDLRVLSESLVKLLKEADAYTESWQSAAATGRAVDRTWAHELSGEKAGQARHGERQWAAGASGESNRMSGMQAVEKVKSLYGEYKQRPSPMYKNAILQVAKEFNIDLSKLGIVFNESLEEGWDDMMKAVQDREKEKGTGKFDKKKTTTGTVYSRKADKDSSESDGEEVKDEKPVKRGRGRPKKVSEMTDVEFFQALSEDISAILSEKKMTKSAEEKREKIVKGMKKDTEGFKSRYGSRWKDVMYATATKKALGETRASLLIKESLDSGFQREFNHAELAELKKVANGELSWDDMSEGLQHRVYEYYLHEMPYGVAKARTGDPVEWCNRRLRQDLGEQVGLSPAPTGVGTTVVPTAVSSVKQTLNAALGEDGLDDELDNFERDPLDELRELEQPITLNGGDFYYTADINADPLTWSADDGSTIKVNNIAEIGEYLDKFNQEAWQKFLNGRESVDNLISDGVLILNDVAESLYSNNSPVDEAAEFGTYYYEQLAQKLPPGLEGDEILDAGYEQVKKDLGPRQANYYFNVDEDFATDLASAYVWLQNNKGNTMNESVNQLLKLAGINKDKPKQQLTECGAIAGSNFDKGSLNVSTNYDAVSNYKSVTVSASGEQANMLAQMLANAGLAPIGSAPAQAVVVSDAAVEEEYSNSPNPKVGSLEAQLNSGNDMHRQKSGYSAAAGGDNPMAPRADIKMESVEDRLWREYQSLKNQVAEEKQHYDHYDDKKAYWSDEDKKKLAAAPEKEGYYKTLNPRTGDVIYIKKMSKGNAVKNESKKPDADGDGVPDWADKKPGKDDHADKKDKKKGEKSEHEKQTLMDRSCGK